MNAIPPRDDATTARAPRALRADAPPQDARPPAAAPDRRALRRQRRRVSLLLAVLLPCLAAAVYLWGFAADQYTSEFRFTVRQQQPIGQPAQDAAGASAGGSILGGGNPLLALTQDGQMVVQYLRSRQAMDDVAAALDLGAIYGLPERDVWARLDPDALPEDRLRHWQRFVRPRFDLTSGIVTVEVNAFTAEHALAVARSALTAAERVVNTMATRARTDAVAFARENAARTEAALRVARDRLADYRNRNVLLSPTLTGGTEAGLDGRLREQIADARTQLAALRQSFADPNAIPVQLQIQRIATLEAELRLVQGRVAAPAPRGDAATLATLTSGYSALESDERIAQGAHERAVMALSAAEAVAAQQTAYLEAFVRPALPGRRSFPIRWLVLLEVAACALAIWAIGTLLVQAVRDQMD